MPKVVDVDERRAALIEATVEAIAREGLGNVTMRSIARQAGWTTGIVTHYFTDKRDLLMATFADLADRARRRVNDGLDAGMPLLDAAIEAILPVDEERLTDWRVWLAYQGASVGDDEMAALHRMRVDTYELTLRDGLRQEIAAGRMPGLDDADLDHAAYGLVVSIHGIAVQAVLHPARCTPDVQRRLVTDRLHGLGRTTAADQAYGSS